MACGCPNHLSAEEALAAAEREGLELWRRGDGFLGVKQTSSHVHPFSVCVCRPTRRWLGSYATAEHAALAYARYMAPLGGGPSRFSNQAKAAVPAKPKPKGGRGGKRAGAGRKPQVVIAGAALAALASGPWERAALATETNAADTRGAAQDRNCSGVVTDLEQAAAACVSTGQERQGLNMAGSGYNAAPECRDVSTLA
mmetsp:Transcript_40366/g.131107  ORF Transcript_40366/g.131107 Transcript_40366/m.131107 type:complete len:198 (-) Transcript_40366:256-849(-)